MNTSSVPRLDLAPKRKKPLSLWNPLDYLTLLYWVFFFPQAIRWYVETFGKPEYQRKAGFEVWVALRNDPVQRNLILHTLVILVVLLPAAAWGLEVLGVPINWGIVMIGVASVVLFGMGLVVSLGVASGVAVGVAFVVVSVVSLGETFGVVFVAAFGIASGLLFSVAIGAAGGKTGVVMGSMVLGVAFGLSFGETFGFSIAFAVPFVATFGRVLEWLAASLLRRARVVLLGGTQTAWLPLPGLQRQVENWLEDDWVTGISDVNQLLAFTSQFISAIAAVNAVLARLPVEKLLACVSVLTEKPFGWGVLRYSSVGLRNALWREFDLFIFSGKWRRERFSSEPRFDTPARAACAGFWYWHENEAGKAAEVFAVAKEILHGAEIYGIAQAIVAGQKATTLQDVAQNFSLPEIEPTESLPHGLRPGTLRVLRMLSEVAAEARTAHHALAPLNRSAAIGRANAALTNLLETGADFCPEPEWPLIEEIVKKWRDIVSKAGGVIGAEVLRQPVLNPYEGYSGLPVTGHTFVGRRAIMSQIERHWANPGAMPPLILYGHRRMGKSSILRNLDKGLPRNTLLVYLDMQGCATLINHTGDLLREFAKEICEKCAPIFPEGAPEVCPTDYTDVGTARFALNALLARLNQNIGDRRLVLAVDEFETIQDKIDAGSIDPDVLKYLRSRIQEYHWLALIFAGLHQLDELGRDYKSVFYGQAEHIRVSYLSEADALDLIARPHPDFALEYAPELRAELYRLTYGQPYLLQRLCWELVERWNERFLREGESTPRELALDELPPILTPDFYHAAGYYFDGVWSNITEGERTVLRVMASRESSWTRDELSTTLPIINLDAVFELLHRHDIVLEDAAGADADRVRFASELLRRWIVQYSSVPTGQESSSRRDA